MNSACAVRALDLLQRHLPRCLGSLAIDYAGDFKHNLTHWSLEWLYCIRYPCRVDCNETSCIRFNLSRIGKMTHTETTTDVAFDTTMRSNGIVLTSDKWIRFMLPTGTIGLYDKDGILTIQHGIHGTSSSGRASSEFVKKAFEIVEAYLARFNESRSMTK